MKQDTAIRTILMVEDEPLVRFVGVLALSEAGYKVLEAANAEQALRVLDSGAAIDLLFTDVEMPGALDGKGLARCVHDQWPDIRIAITSGCGDHAKDARRLGGFFIAKPYAAEKLVELVQTERSTSIAA